MTLTSLYSRAADVAPDDPALIGLDSVVSWADAEQMSAALATTLVDHGIGPGDRVAVARLKDAASYLAVHGIQRAGAVVVPVDPMAPPHLGRQVLADAAVAAVVGDARTIAALDPAAIDELELRVQIVDGLDPESSPAAAVGALVDWTDAIAPSRRGPLPAVGPDDLAYLIYTSGSTGVPKGIVHTHRSALAYARWAADAHLRTGDRLAGISGFHYDMSTLELYAAPAARVPVVVMGEAHLRFPASFLARSCEEDVTVWYAVTSMLRQVVERGAVADHDTSSLRSIMFAGEPYPPGALRDLFHAFPDAEVSNVYGPAEVNECSYHVLSAPPRDGEEVPIGPAWFDAHSRVVDGDGNEVADGETGELWISVATVMEGYWRRPELSAQKLTARADGPHWYATGDLVVRDSEGVLWFRGRADNQIKLRGTRVELEGVESVVADAPGVVQAVVGPDGEGSDASNLLAAVVVGDGSEFDEGAIRRFCAERLPGAVVPRQFALHDRFPLTPSGKIDRTAVRRTMIETHAGATAT